MQDVAGESGGGSVERVPSMAVGAVHVPSCAGCGYAFTGLAVAKCPECGYEPDAEEIAGAELRRSYQEVTALDRWTWAVWGAMLLLTSWWMELGIGAWALGFAALLLMVGVGMHYFAKEVPLAYQRLARGIWIGLAGWVLLPWFLALASMAVFNAWDREFNGGGFTRWGAAVSSESMAACFIGGVVGTIAGPWIWKRRWRRVSRAAGLPSKAIALADENVGWRAAFIPGLVLFIVPGGVALLIWILERLRVDWY